MKKLLISYGGIGMNNTLSLFLCNLSLGVIYEMNFPIYFF